MPLPANVTTVTVLGTFLTPEGDPSTGTVSFTPSSWLTNSGANVAIPNSSVVKTLGTAGSFSALLPITDDADLSPSGWVYGVSEVVDGVSQSYNILIPGTVAVGGTVFLADLVPAAPAGPEYYSLASSLAIGTVTTVATGGSATATITGLAPSQVLDLGIPTGATGTVASAGSGSVGTAAVAPTGDPNTGIYFPAADQVGITTGGSAAAIFAAGAISNPTFTGTATFPAGTATAPSITTTGDTNTGVHFPAADTVAIATAGAERVRVLNTGSVAIGRTDNTDTTLNVNGTIGASTLAASAQLHMIRRNGTFTSPTTVANSESLGVVYFRGHDGTNVQVAGYLLGAVDGTVSAGVVPGRIMHFLANSAGTATERMRVDSNGLITGTGTSLGAWTAYTPTLGGTGWALGDGTASGAYCQIGKVVIFRARITLGATSTAGGSGLTITVPVTGNATQMNGGLHVALNDTSASKWFLGSLVWSSTTAIQPRSIGTGGETAILTTSAPFTWATGDQIDVSGTYQAS